MSVLRCREKIGTIIQIFKKNLKSFRILKNFQELADGVLSLSTVNPGFARDESVLPKHERMFLLRTVQAYHVQLL